MEERIKIIKSVIEKLLFPLHIKVYEKINKIIEKCLLEHPCFLEEMFYFYNLGYKQNTKYSCLTNKTKLYKLDIVIEYHMDKYPLIDIEEISNPIIKICDKGFKSLNTNEYDGNSFVINIYYNNKIYSFSIALEYILGFQKENVLKDNACQIYCHTIVPKDLLIELIKTGNNSQEYINEKSFKYIGYTKRSWHTRFKEHLNYSKKGSQRLFQKALRGEICEIGMIEHCIERCGLSMIDAVILESQEIALRSLHKIYKMGLNMISGKKNGFIYK